MKNKQLLLPKILLLFGFFFIIPNQSEAQILKKLGNKAKKKIEQEAEKRAERRINKKIDKEFDKAEDVLDGKKKTDKNLEKGNTNTNQNSQGNNSNNQDSSQENEATVNKPNVVWSKFDFIPGDEVIFEDIPSTDEENGEFPSRWDLVQGQVEIANVDGEAVMMFIDGGEIVPYLKNSSTDYLPEIFTIEFDFYKPAGGNRLTFYLTDQKNQRNNHVYDNAQEFDITPIRVDAPEGSAVEHSGRDYNYCKNGCWTHVSIAYTKGKLKVYLDDTRLVNIPHYSYNPTGFTMYPYFASAKDNKAFYVKNVRIAKGGVKYYDRVLSEGKIIVNGIKFDVNKATLKPESMGPINEIYKLMIDNPAVNFSVEGHTDSDGDDANNQTLSEARGKTVMNKLIEMGIPSNRLKSNGFGESKPIDNNSTPEGKANNRRVEFVKFSGNSNNSSSNNSNSNFDELDKKTIAAKLESLPDNFKIPISDNSGIVNGQGTVILYATTGGKFGKMEILDIDKNNNYELTLKYVTYNYDGSVYSKHNKIQVEGTYGCDLDEGYSGDVDSSDAEFFLSRQGSATTTINSGEEAILKILK
jgi:outer membrane protein OmpA-like peptidoglycan-associated protein